MKFNPSRTKQDHNKHNAEDLIREPSLLQPKSARRRSLKKSLASFGSMGNSSRREDEGEAPEARTWEPKASLP
jgi:hypothetical protein